MTIIIINYNGPALIFKLFSTFFKPVETLSAVQVNLIQTYEKYFRLIQRRTKWKEQTKLNRMIKDEEELAVKYGCDSNGKLPMVGEVTQQKKRKLSENDEVLIIKKYLLESKLKIW